MRLLLRIASVLIALVLLGSAMKGQTQPTPHIPTRSVEYISWCPLWRTDGTFRSTIRLTNHHRTVPINVTVTLYMADGTPYRLDPVPVPPSGVQTVDVNAALAAAPPSIQTHLSAFGSAALSYRYDWDAVIYGQIALIDLRRSMEYTYSFAPPSLGRTVRLARSATDPHTAPDRSETLQKYEGLWWRHNAETAGFVALLNTRAESISVDLAISGLGKAVSQTITLLPYQTHWIDLGTFFNGERSRVGGITISYTGEPYSLLVAGGLKMQVRGMRPIYLLICSCPMPNRQVPVSTLQSA